MQNVCKIGAENFPLSPPGCAELRYLVLKRFSSRKFYFHTGEPQLGVYSALSLLRARKPGSSDNSVFLKTEIALDTEKKSHSLQDECGQPQACSNLYACFFSLLSLGKVRACLLGVQGSAVPKQIIAACGKQRRHRGVR